MMDPVITKHLQQRKSNLRHLPVFTFLSGLALCALLLAACGSVGTGTGIGGTATPGATPTPTISLSLKDQGNKELQTFSIVD